MSETCNMSWLFHPNFDDSFNRHMGDIRRSDLWWGKWWCHIQHSALAAHDGMLTFIFLDSTITITEQWEQLCGYELGGADHINQSPVYFWAGWEVLDCFYWGQMVFLSQAIRYKTSSRALIWPWREEKKTKKKQNWGQLIIVIIVRWYWEFLTHTHETQTNSLKSRNWVEKKSHPDKTGIPIYSCK